MCAPSQLLQAPAPNSLLLLLFPSFYLGQPMQMYSQGEEKTSLRTFQLGQKMSSIS